jgi:hypothetical protein
MSCLPRLDKRFEPTAGRPLFLLECLCCVCHHEATGQQATEEAAPAHLAGVHVLPSTALVCAEKGDAPGEGTEHR